MDTRYWEPCEECGRDGAHLLVAHLNADGHTTLGILCDECLAEKERARLTEKERRLLAEWGTIGQQRRTA
jgi:hypothetical protein